MRKTILIFSCCASHDQDIFGSFDRNNDLLEVAVTQDLEKQASVKTWRISQSVSQIRTATFVRQTALSPFLSNSLFIGFFGETCFILYPPSVKGAQIGNCLLSASLHGNAASLQTCCKVTAKLLQRHCKAGCSDTAKLLQRYCKAVAALLQSCCSATAKLVAATLQNCCSITAKLLRIFAVVVC